LFLSSNKFYFFQQNIPIRTTTTTAQKKEKKEETISFYFDLMQSFRCLQKENKNSSLVFDFTIYTTRAQVKEKTNKQK